jgi:hypothetical protein
MSEVYKDCNFWKIRACKGMTTNNCWNTQCPDYKRDPDYSWISTKELTEEMSKREGVKEIVVQPYEWYQISGEKEQWDHGTGPARILVVWD